MPSKNDQAAFRAWAESRREALKHASGAQLAAVFRTLAAEAPDASYPGRLWESELAGRHRRAARGGWFTPEPAARALVRRALRFLPEDGAELRVLDPACGAGVFPAAVAAECRRDFRLAGFDLEPVALELTRARVAPLPIELRRGDTLRRRPRPDCDLIVGNPPYVALPALSAAARAYYRKNFENARGRFNTYALFLEWCVKSLRPGGVGALVLPDRLWLNTRDQSLRDWFSTRCEVLEVTQLQYALFADAVVNSSLVIFRRAPGLGGASPVLLRIAGSDAEVSDAPGKSVTLAGLSRCETPLFAKIRARGLPYGRIAEIRDGIIQSKVGRELFSPDEIRDTDRPLLIGRDVFAGRIADAHRRIDYRPETMKALETARGGKGLRLRRPEIFEAPKILTRQTADTLIAAYDAEGRYYYANTLHGARIRDPRFRPEYVTRYLNSPVARYCYRRLADEAGKAFAQVKLAKLRELPVPLLDAAEQEEVVRDSGWDALYRLLTLSSAEIFDVEVEK